MPGIALCAIGRRENDYAREWVDHHFVLGFDHIIIYDNNRRGEERFEAVLGDLMREGRVTVFNYRDRAGVQCQAYTECYHVYGKRFDWIAFFDFDEFLTIHPSLPQDVHPLMARYKGHDCLLLNWMSYGDNGLVYQDARPVTERFAEPLPLSVYLQRPDRPENEHCKSIVRGGGRKIRFERQPHVPAGHALRCCDATGKRCEQSPFHPYDYSVAWLRHYATKTVEEWARNKWQKGTGNKPTMELFRQKYAGRFLQYNEWTEEKERVFREITGEALRE